MGNDSKYRDAAGPSSQENEARGGVSEVSDRRDLATRDSQMGAEPAGTGPRDATRGGVNRPALPGERGRECPLSVIAGVHRRGDEMLALTRRWVEGNSFTENVAGGNAVG